MIMMMRRRTIITKKKEATNGIIGIWSGLSVFIRCFGICFTSKCMLEVLMECFLLVGTFIVRVLHGYLSGYPGMNTYIRAELYFHERNICIEMILRASFILYAALPVKFTY